MPLSPKPFKRTANLCNTAHQTPNLLGVLTCQLNCWLLGSQGQADQLQTPTHLSCTAS